MHSIIPPLLLVMVPARHPFPEAPQRPQAMLAAVLQSIGAVQEVPHLPFNHPSVNMATALKPRRPDLGELLKARTPSRGPVGQVVAVTDLGLTSSPSHNSMLPNSSVVQRRRRSRVHPVEQVLLLAVIIGASDLQPLSVKPRLVELPSTIRAAHMLPSHSFL